MYFKKTFIQCTYLIKLNTKFHLINFSSLNYIKALTAIDTIARELYYERIDDKKKKTQ